MVLAEGAELACTEEDAEEEEEGKKVFVVVADEGVAEEVPKDLVEALRAIRSCRRRSRAGE